MKKKSTFRNPGVEFRAKPFWAWNAELDADEIRRQMRIFKEMGCGGAFMHARIGLSTPYLSKKWFDAVEDAVDEARREGMEAWLYDEDRCPSGSAGGIVTKNPKYRNSFMGLCIIDNMSEAPEGDVFALFDVDLKDELIYSYRRIAYSPRAKAEKGHKLFFFQIRQQMPNSCFNGCTYVDTLSKEAIGEFIRVTHKAYARRFKKDFSKTIPGIFTDEPSFDTTRKMMAGNWYRSPWTEKLEAAFKKHHGYGIADFLPELYFRKDGEEFSKIRYDYRYTLADMFSTNFARQIGEWCAKNGLAFTGHLLAEEPFIRSAGSLGSAMRVYQYFQIPGIDILTSQGLESRGNGCGEMKSFAGGSGPIVAENGNTGLKSEYLVVKQCASVKDQFARKWMISETYGCTGWHSVFAEYKAISDWQAALGVNLRCPHLAWYSMEGEAKRDFPAAISYQSPWWKDYKIVEDYFARVNVLLTEGKAVKDIAVISPGETIWGWAAVAQYRHTEAKPWDTYLKEIQINLLEEHFDFDYVDEGILAEQGAVKGACLQVAKARYNTVIVPPMISIRKTTLDFLLNFKKNGGSLIFVEPVPTHLSAVPADDLRLKIEGAILLASTDKASLSGALKHLPARHISVKNAEGMEYSKCFYQMRYDASRKRTVVFIAHLLQTRRSGKLTVTVPAEGNLYEYDCVKGDIYQYKSVKMAGCLSFELELEPYGSAMFVIESSCPDALPLRKKMLPESGRIDFVSNDWRIARDEPNAFPLDYPEYSISGGLYKPAEEIMLLDRKIRKELNLPLRSGNMCQPWAADASAYPAKTELKLKYQFLADTIPAGPSYLVLENPSDFKISLNGEYLSSDDDEGWWIDRSFRKLKVNPFILKYGLNELVLETEYRFSSGLECLYFIGEFGVKWVNDIAHIIEEPKTLKAGSWVEQGFPAYSGAMIYQNKFIAPAGRDKHYILKFPEWQGCLLKVYVNGALAGILPWPPYELDISTFVYEGQANNIDIELVSTRKNLLGPLHYQELFPNWTGPDEYLKSTIRSYQALPYGLIENPYISIL